jgi:ribosomal-protein-alanine N-acetyltransferase
LVLRGHRSIFAYFEAMSEQANRVRAIERERLRSLVEVDLPVARSLHAADFQLITPRGTALTKAEYLDLVTSGLLDYRRFEPTSDIEVLLGDRVPRFGTPRGSRTSAAAKCSPRGAGIPTATGLVTAGGRPCGRKPPESSRRAEMAGNRALPTDLQGERIRLRPLESADFAAVHAYASDPEVTRYTAWGPNDEAATRAFLDFAMQLQGADNANYRFGVVLRDSDELVGGCGIEIESEEHRRASFGYSLARRHWGLGYATEVALLLKSLAFDSLGVHRLEATCHPDNVRSIRVLAKAGLTVEGRLLDHMLMRGEWRDSLLYAAINPAG